MTPSRREPTARGLARRRLGVAGEAAAAAWYVERGFTVVCRNWRCKQGELDLVLADRRMLVFCEVKTRSSNRFGTPLEAVTADKQRRLRALGAYWLRENGGSGGRGVRFDVAAVMNGDVLVVEGAF